MCYVWLEYTQVRNPLIPRTPINNRTPSTSRLMQVESYLVCICASRQLKYKYMFSHWHGVPQHIE